MSLAHVFGQDLSQHCVTRCSDTELAASPCGSMRRLCPGGRAGSYLWGEELDLRLLVQLGPPVRHRVAPCLHGLRHGSGQ
jgi:hypothetical protein